MDGPLYTGIYFHNNIKRWWVRIHWNTGDLPKGHITKITKTNYEEEN